jgi:hypothetical protein
MGWGRGLKGQPPMCAARVARVGVRSVIHCRACGVCVVCGVLIQVLRGRHTGCGAGATEEARTPTTDTAVCARSTLRLVVLCACICVCARSADGCMCMVVWRMALPQYIGFVDLCSFCRQITRIRRTAVRRACGLWLWPIAER